MDAGDDAVVTLANGDDEGRRAVLDAIMISRRGAITRARCDATDARAAFNASARRARTARGRSRDSAGEDDISRRRGNPDAGTRRGVRAARAMAPLAEVHPSRPTAGAFISSRRPLVATAKKRRGRALRRAREARWRRASPRASRRRRRRARVSRGRARAAARDRRRRRDDRARDADPPRGLIVISSSSAPRLRSRRRLPRRRPPPRRRRRARSRARSARRR